MKRFNAVRASVLTLAALAVAAPVQAATEDAVNPDPVENASEVRVLNNHDARVSVYAVTGSSRLYLGTVNRTQFKSFQVPAGTVRLQVFPRSAPAGLGTLASEAEGIDTKDVEIATGQALQLFIEPDLDASSASVLDG